MSKTDEAVYPASLLNAWKSARLIYRGIEEDEDDKATICEIMNGDPVAVAMGSQRHLKPGTRISGLEFYEFTKHNPLRVMICLPADHNKVNETYKTESEKDKKAKPTPIGLISLFPPHDRQSSHHRDVRLGISLMSPWRGKGYGAEAINWCLDWGFRWGDYHRVGLTTFSYNERAVKLYRSLGFVEEGRVRESLYHDRGRYDEVYFGMLVREWEVLRGLRKEGN